MGGRPLSHARVITRTQPTSHRGLAWIFALVGASILGDTALYTVLPVYAAELDLPLVGVGLILTANRIIRLLTNPLAARLFERVGTRVAFPLAMLTAALSTSAYGLTRYLLGLVAARLLWGFSWSVVRLTGYDAIGKRVPAAVRGYWVGRFRASYRMGSLVAALSAGALADAWGYPTPFLVFSLITLIAAGLALRWRGHLFEPAAVFSPARDLPDRAVRPDAADPYAMAPHTRRSPVPVWGLGMLVAWASEGLVPSTLGLLVRLRFGETVAIGDVSLGAATLTGLLLSFRWGADFFLAPAAGALGDRWGTARTAATSLLVAAAAMLILLNSRSPVSFALASILLLGALSASVTLAEALAIHGARRSGQARHLAAYTTAVDLGSALGPLVGYVLSAGLGIVTVYGAAAALLVGAAGLARYGLAR